MSRSIIHLSVELILNSKQTLKKGGYNKANVIVSFNNRTTVIFSEFIVMLVVTPYKILCSQLHPLLVSCKFVIQCKSKKINFVYSPVSKL